MGCGDDPFSREPIRIGIVVAQTGPIEAVAVDLTRSAFLVEREINASGGLLDGRPIELIVKDDRTDPDVAARVIDELIQDDGVVGIVGPMTSGALLNVHERVREAQIPQLSASATSLEISNAQPENDRYLFRTVPSDLAQARVIARHLGTVGCANTVIMNQMDDYGSSLGEGVEARATELGATIAERLEFPVGRPSYSSEVAQVAAQNPDCVVLVALATDGGTILREWTELPDEPDVTWIGTDGLKNSGFPEASGNAMILDGFLGTAPITAPSTATNNDFVAAFQSLFGTERDDGSENEPLIYSQNQYDAVAMLALAIEKAGSTDGPAVRDALFEVSRGESDQVISALGLNQGLIELREGRAIDYNGASGPVDFDGFGDVISDYEIWRYDASSDSFLEEARIRAGDI